MIIFNSAAEYFDTAETLLDRITKIDNVINALLSTAAKAAGTENITSYSLNDGQTQINTVYRGTAAVMASINAFERLKQMYVNQLNGRHVVLIDSKNFNGRC